MSFDSFFRSYLDTALWSSAGGDDEYLDAKYSSGDFAARTRKHLEKDAKDFYEKNEHLWSGKTPGRSSGDERAGHDFWLTRNGHGAGFWEGEYEDEAGNETGNALTKASKRYGEENLYISRGKVRAEREPVIRRSR